MNDPNAMLLATPEGLVGHTLADRYHVKKLLGDGGMGSVYLAEHVTLRKRVAIKVLHQELCRDQTQVDRFLQEARAASMIGHENIVDIVDFGPVPGGSVFFAMEFLEGQDLSDLLIDEGRLGWARARGLTLQILRALGAAHGKGIIHRDLKPANCFLVKRSDGRDFVKLLDFGIAKVTDPESGSGGGLTRTGAVFGTAKYMAPEQACGEPADARTDVYAASICLYEFLTGTVPYDGDNFMRVLSRHLTEPLTPPTTMAPDADISPAVEAVIVKALSKKPDDRYQSMAEFAAAIESIGLDGNLAGSAYSGPMVVNASQAQANAGAGNTLWLPEGGSPAPSQPPQGRGGTLLLDPNNAPDLEFGTMKLGPQGWAHGAGSRPPSGAVPSPTNAGRPPTSAPVPGTHAPTGPVSPTSPPGPQTSPATNAPGADYTMFATEKRSPAKFIALLAAGAIVAIGGGGLAAWILLGDDEPEKDKVVQTDKKPELPKLKEPPPPEPEADLEVGELDVEKPPEPEPEPDVVEIEPEPEPEPKQATPTNNRPRHGKSPRRDRSGRKDQNQKAKEALSSADVGRGFGRASAAVKKCRGGIPGMKLRIKADINRDGQVVGARALNQTHLKDLTRCAVQAVKSNAKFAKTTKLLDSKTFTFKF